MFEILDDQPKHFVAHNGRAEFKIAKSMLSKPKLDEFAKLCKGGRVKMAKGGPVQKMAEGEEVVPAPTPSWSPETGPIPAPEPPIGTTAGVQRAFGTLSQIPEALRVGFGGEPAAPPPPPVATPPEPAPVQPVQGPTAAQVSVAGTAGFPNFSGQLRSAEKLQEQGIRGVAGAQAATAEGQAKALDTYQQTLKEHQAASEQHFNALAAEHDKIVADIQSSHIDPNRLWSNRSNGEKASAMLGMILGGIGSGLTGQPNAALHVIQNAIDRDIDAQKAELGKKHTLLADNYRQTGNLFQAEQMTRLQMSAALEGQMKLAATRSGSQAAQGQADIAIAEARKSLIGPLMQMAQFQAMAGMVQGGQGGAGYVKSSALPPSPSEISLKGVAEMRKDANERRVDLPELGQGAWTYAKTGKDAEETRHSFAAMSNLERQVNHLGQLARTHGTAIHVPGTEASAAYDATASSVITELNKLQDLNRLNENEYKSFGNMIPTAREWLTASGPAKLRELSSRIQGKRQSEYTHRLGLDSSMFRPKTERAITVK